MDKDGANREKDLGNAAMSAGDFQGAIEHYTKGLDLDSSNHVLYSNRSAAHASLKQYDKALEDADKTIAAKPDWSKGYSRKGAALCYLDRLPEAIAAYEEALQLEPGNEQIKQALADVEAQHSKGGRGNIEDIFGSLFKGDIIGKLALNETTRPFLDDPSFVATLKSLQNNPGNLTQHLQDQRFATALAVLMGIPPKPPKSSAEPRTQHTEEKKSEPGQVPKQEKKSEPSPSQLAPEKNQAQAEKEKGNEAYKKKEFEVAIAHYNNAIALDPEEMAYLLNIAAALFEMKKYEECIKMSDQAIETGRRVYADYKMIAKAFKRAGDAHVRLEQYTEAIKAFNAALTEFRTPETLEALRKAEKLKQEKEKTDYFSVEKSQQAKTEGNEAFRTGKFPDAIKWYTEAIERNPKDHVLYSNRAACYTKLGEYPLGLKDCDKCIELEPTFVKGFTRKGHIQFFLKQYHKCLETYDQGLKIEPENQELIEGVQRTIAAINARQNVSDADSQKEAMANAARDPELQEILSDPMIRRVLSDLQGDPQAAQVYLKDPLIASKLKKLIAAGILKTK